jgi:hypothetical protein
MSSHLNLSTHSQGLYKLHGRKEDYKLYPQLPIHIQGDSKLQVREADYKLLQSQNADTANFCSLQKADTTNFSSELKSFVYSLSVNFVVYFQLFVVYVQLFVVLCSLLVNFVV